ncbi:MAG: hypothetical protein L6Q35_11360 [Phycisphaerales bacterium]|nr:hypothetical protein [Phycisphaerales bacterium]
MFRPPLYYTFGNHMHWVDMQWLWGYDVLPGSVDDMLRLIEETGARGNINFDAIGYEKMAVECPEHLAKLRDAVGRGLVEPVGCSYGQPYGLFHGLESNIRQLIYGVRTTRRLLGVRPRTFWEEEFYFFPQLPQLLAQCGYTGACLFFQWTWHTPEIPMENGSLILWEGADGTRLPALPRNDLNVHQWPEDFDGLLEKVESRGTGQQASRSSERTSRARAESPALPDARCPVPDASTGPASAPAIVQWLELMPSKDWMCRSEVLLPRLKELMNDPRFEVRPRTAGALIAELLGGRALEPAADLPARRYTMDDVWHGMTLGKNADAHLRASRETEAILLHAEALSATVSLLGRPYPSWDVYPTWELDEAWRELLAAQHHDNHECEGLCGFVGHHQMQRAQAAAAEVAGRVDRLLRSRSGESDDAFTNPLGWTLPLEHSSVPPFGYSSSATDPEEEGPDSETDLPDFTVTLGGKPADRVAKGAGKDEDGDPQITWKYAFGEQSVVAAARPMENGWALTVDFRDSTGELPIKPGPGFGGALELVFSIGPDQKLIADSPGTSDAATPTIAAKRKYPQGDWMTSPQWFEQVNRPFTARSFVDVCGADGSGTLIVHDGSQQWFRDERSLRAVLTAYDPWDEQRYGVPGHGVASFVLIRHGPIAHADRVRLATEAADAGRVFATHAAPVGGGTPTPADAVPARFGPLEVCGAPGVLAHAFFRESMKGGEHFPDWAGHRMARDSGGACTHPFVIRLVEWNGEPAEVTLKLAGPVAMAAKTNLLGEVLHDGPPRRADKEGGGWSPSDTGWLTVEPVAPPEWAIVNGKPIEFRGEPITWSQVRFRMRPREIATIYADMLMGRKEFRDLDAKREVWATVHKQPAT